MLPQPELDPEAEGEPVACNSPEPKSAPEWQGHSDSRSGLGGEAGEEGQDVPTVGEGLSVESFLYVNHLSFFFRTLAHGSVSSLGR